MISTILVALDKSQRAPLVLRIATELAERFDASLHLFRSIPITQMFPAAAAFADANDPLPAFLQTEATSELADLARGNARALANPPVVLIGPPPKTIREAAERVHADLIVVGGHGVHGLDHFLGTTTGSVASAARCHVFVVHDPAAANADT